MRHLVRILIRATGVVALLGACGGAGDAGDPVATIESYSSEYNAGDLDGVMALFAEDAIMTGHPAAARVTGNADIRAVHADEVGGPGKYTLTNVTAAGTTVTWDHVWGGNDNGEVFRFCVEGLSATVENGLITSWTWPDTDFQCDR